MTSPPPTRPAHERVERLNIGLMLLSCGLAFALPFELFLFSYAVLGPLHYLTEIAWLHQRRYFGTRRGDAWLLAGLCAALLAGHYGLLGLDMARWATAVNATVLGAAAAVAFTADLRWRAAVLVGSAGAGAWLAGNGTAHDLLRIFLPTLIHVWVFTAAFMLLGALRQRSLTGLASLLVFGAASAACLVLDLPRSGLSPDSEAGLAYRAVAQVNVSLADWLGLAPMREWNDLYISSTGQRVARFISFAYTYHYLNWFSKTSLIQWHRMPRAWAVMIVALWLASVGLYAWDAALGLTVLFGLSYLHVYFELPLNHRTFVAIGRETAGRLGVSPKPG